METKKASGQSTKIIIVIGIIVIALLAAIVVILLGRQPQADVNEGNVPTENRLFCGGQGHVG